MTRLFKYHEFLDNRFKSNESESTFIVNEEFDITTGIYKLDQTIVDKKYKETNLNNFVSNMQECFYNFIYFTLTQSDELYSLSKERGSEKTHFDYKMKQIFIGKKTYKQVAEMIKNPFISSTVDGKVKGGELFKKISEDSENKEIVGRFENATWLKAQLKKEYKIQNSSELMSKIYEKETFENIKVPNDSEAKRTYEYFKARFENGISYFQKQSQSLFNDMVKTDPKYSGIMATMTASENSSKMINETQIIRMFTEYYTNFHLWLYANSLSSNIGNVQVKETPSVSQTSTTTKKSTTTVVSPSRPVSSSIERSRKTGLLD